jgi:hypothetical protein
LNFETKEMLHSDYGSVGFKFVSNFRELGGEMFLLVKAELHEEVIKQFEP